jgi:hypothetical protein
VPDEEVSMRPSSDELLASLRYSLSAAILPKVEDRWARYVGTAMDLVLQHLQLRLAGETSSLTEDSADMAAVLAGIADTVAVMGAEGDDGRRALAASLGELLPAPGAVTPAGGDLAGLTAQNERLRAVVVDVLRWLDEAGERSPYPEVEDIRDRVYRLVRRQTDRNSALVRPLFMSFGPAAS